MRIHVIGGGPGGLCAAVLLKKADPSRQVHVFERNAPAETFGFGVVFSDDTLREVAAADPETHAAIAARFHHWDDVHVHYKGRRLDSTGHGFAGISRRKLLLLLHRRCRDFGVDLRFESAWTGLSPHLEAADLVVAADGVGSRVRTCLADAFQPETDLRPNRFVWLGVAKPFPAFSFYFKEDEHGLWRVHAYQYDAAGRSTFIVETTERAWRRAGMSVDHEPTTISFLSRLFARELGGCPLVGNRSRWRRFPTIRTGCWSTWASAGGAASGARTAPEASGTPRSSPAPEAGPAERDVHRRLPRRSRDALPSAEAGPAEPPSAAGAHVVLLGDAAHTAHFSVGSGTRLAMLDAIALAGALDRHDDVGEAMDEYEAERRPAVESLQRAAQASLQWFEDTERHMRLEPIQFAFSLLTRSLRVSHENLRQRDPAFVEEVDRWVARKAEKQAGRSIERHEASLGIRRAPGDARPPPPLFTPFRLRELVLPNRVGVSAMCQYSASDGAVDDWHLVNLGSRAVGGAGLVMAEMTAVDRLARISPGCAGLYKEEHVGAWRRVVEFVHRRTHAKIGVQLGHAGRKGSTRLHWEGADEPLEQGGWPIVSASPIGYFDHSPVPAELDEDGMDALVNDFARGAAMAEEAGFDLVELHMAHGYLLASFLSPLTNLRQDEYGDGLDGRLRFPLRVLAAVRAAWPEEKPVSVRLSAVDWWPGGNEPEDAVEIARAFKGCGCDVVDVSAGQTVPCQRPRYGRQFQTPFADRIRHEVGIATMAVGAISSFEDVNGIVASGRADLCLMARAHLWDPYWTRHAAYALGYPPAWPDQYDQALQGFTPRLGIGEDGRPSAGASQ